MAQNGGPSQLAPRRLILTTAQPSVGERYLRDLFMVVEQERRGYTHYQWDFLMHADRLPEAVSYTHLTLPTNREV